MEGSLVTVSNCRSGSPWPLWILSSKSAFVVLEVTLLSLLSCIISSGVICDLAQGIPDCGWKVRPTYNTHTHTHTHTQCTCMHMQRPHTHTHTTAPTHTHTQALTLTRTHTRVILVCVVVLVWVSSVFVLVCGDSIHLYCTYIHVCGACNMMLWCETCITGFSEVAIPLCSTSCVNAKTKFSVLHKNS